jgi:SHAQKYF class myb-like DNA-binding protein
LSFCAKGEEEKHPEQIVVVVIIIIMDRPLQHRLLFQPEPLPLPAPSAFQLLDDSTEGAEEEEEEEDFLDYPETTSDDDEQEEEEEEEEERMVETMAATAALRRRQDQPSATTKPNYSRGRWTTEEHERFLHGLALYGKNWRPIASYVQTRTIVQVRTHAQKYFVMLRRAASDRGVKKKRTTLTKIGATYHVTTTPCRLPTSAAAGEDKGEGEQRVVQQSNKKTPVAAAPSQIAAAPSPVAAAPLGPAAERKRKVPAAAEVHQQVEEEKEKEVDSSSEPFWLSYKTAVASTRTTTIAAAISAPKRMIVWPSKGDHHDDNQIVVPIVAAVTTAGSGDATTPPTTASSSRTRGSLEYVDLMKANCSIFHALPSADQEVFVRNFAHFLVRGFRVDHDG